MASADFDHIRALLIAQTAEPEPKRGKFSVFGRRAPAPQTPLALAEAPRRAPPTSRPRGEDDQELLLDYICLPVAAPQKPVVVPEALSPLPPPAPRSAFGRRSDEDGLEILLGGEALEEPSAVPYFPEDLADGEAAMEQLFTEPQPMRPWIKALRGASRPAIGDGPLPLHKPVVEPAPASQQKPVRSLRRPAAALAPAPERAVGAASLSRDLLEALELALQREHHRLDDRLTALAA